MRGIAFTFGVFYFFCHRVYAYMKHQCESEDF
jgi:hypothetical protein